MGKSESRGSNESVLPATSRGVVRERRSVFSLKTENILSSRCDSGHEIEKSGGALSPMEGTTREGLRKRVAVLNREIGKMLPKIYGLVWTASFGLINGLLLFSCMYYLHCFFTVS